MWKMGMNSSVLSRTRTHACQAPERPPRRTFGLCRRLLASQRPRSTSRVEALHFGIPQHKTAHTYMRTTKTHTNTRKQKKMTQAQRGQWKAHQALSLTLFRFLSTRVLGGLLSTEEASDRSSVCALSTSVHPPKTLAAPPLSLQNLRSNISSARISSSSNSILKPGTLPRPRILFRIHAALLGHRAFLRRRMKVLETSSELQNLRWPCSISVQACGCGCGFGWLGVQ